MNMNKGMEVWFHPFLTSTLVTGDRAASRLGRFEWEAAWVFRAGMDAVRSRKTIPSPGIETRFLGRAVTVLTDLSCLHFFPLIYYYLLLVGWD
jgi:hypothetical protein